MLVSVWARTRCSRTRKPSIGGCGLMYFRGQETSVSRAKRAITDYKKAIGDPEGPAELTVFYCERALDSVGMCAIKDAAYFRALVRMFGASPQHHGKSENQRPERPSHQARPRAEYWP
jgi:hypothetical protein